MIPFMHRTLQNESPPQKDNFQVHHINDGAILASLDWRNPGPVSRGLRFLMMTLTRFEIWEEISQS